MRGCLVVLVLATLFVAAGAWFAGPRVAGFLVETGLTAAGLQASEVDVAVESEPNWEVVSGRADRVRIGASDATFREVQIERLDLDLRDVTLIDRRATELNGTIEGVVVRDGGPADGLRIRMIRLAGGETIAASTEVESSEVEALVARGVRERTGEEPDDVVLAAPDRLAVVVRGLRVEGRLSIDAGGALLLRSEGLTSGLIGDVVLVAAGTLPIELQSVEVRDGSVVLEGVLATGLLG